MAPLLTFVYWEILWYVKLTVIKILTLTNLFHLICSLELSWVTGVGVKDWSINAVNSREGVDIGL